MSEVRFWTRECLTGVTFMTGSYRNTRFSRHSHSTYAFGVVQSGALGFRYLGEPCVAVSGDINTVVPGEVHDGYSASDEGWSYRMAYVDSSEVSKISSDVWGRDRGLPFIPHGVLNAPDLSALLGELHLGLEASLLDDLSAETLLLTFLGNLVSRFGEYRESPPVSAPIDAVCRFMRENLERNISLQELATVSGLSRWHFLRSFKNKIGLTPHVYLFQLRIRRAEELLRIGRSPVLVALELGFADQSHLTRCFKSFLGTTPGAYQRDFLPASYCRSNFLQ